MDAVFIISRESIRIWLYISVHLSVFIQRFIRVSDEKSFSVFLKNVPAFSSYSEAQQFVGFLKFSRKAAIRIYVLLLNESLQSVIKCMQQISLSSAFLSRNSLFFNAFTTSLHLSIQNIFDMFLNNVEALIITINFKY